MVAVPILVVTTTDLMVAVLITVVTTTDPMVVLTMVATTTDLMAVLTMVVTTIDLMVVIIMVATVVDIMSMSTTQEAGATGVGMVDLPGIPIPAIGVVVSGELLLSVLQQLLLLARLSQPLVNLNTM
jgi:hypothetical protein